MKQIIPFTKTIDLSTNVEEITSISLDKIINSNRDNEITGDFELYLEYKENDISIDTENYTATIPFNISLDDRYDSKDSKVEIDDFYYEIEDSRVILHVDVLVDGLKVAEKELENVIPIRKEEVSEDEKIEEVKSEIKLEEDREDEIEAFIPEEYWNIYANLLADGAKRSFEAKLTGKNDKKIAIEELILDKKTLKPTKLSIRDNSKNVIVYILYNEIEIK